MKKVQWREHFTNENDEPDYNEFHGVCLGPIVKAGKTLLVVYCDDGFVREVAIEDIVPY